jgi:hypothetical protein
MLGVGVGTVNITGSGYLTTSSVTDAAGSTVYLPTGTRIFHIHLISGGSASVLTIQNGQGGTTYIKVTGTANTGADFDFGIYGQSFPLGAYATVDGNIVSAAIVCKADQF